MPDPDPSHRPLKTGLLPAAVRQRLTRLAPDQRAAACAPAGPVLCVAPAGSGKTTTVVARLAWRVATGSPPETICALTFNRRAAAELQQRTDEALAELGVAPGSVRVRTFHALGREILIDAGMDVSTIVARHEVLARLASEPLGSTELRHLDDSFSRLKLDPERGPPPGDVRTQAAFRAYQRELARRGALDLDDLVARAGPALRADDALLARWRGRCRVLFVDEAQDLDRAQLDLALLLAGSQRDIFLVGDDDQTIYAWRLADVRRVLDLASRVPGLRRVDLETNHRCAPEIVTRAARLVAHNAERFRKRIRASSSAHGWLMLAPDSGDDVARARRLLSTWGRGDGSRAVLARTNRQLAPYAAVALELRLPHRVQDDGLALDDPGVRELLDHAVAGAPHAADRPGRRADRLVTLQAVADAVGCPPELASSALAWAAAYPDLAGLRTALLESREARDRLRARGGGLTLATAHGTKGLEWDHVACVDFDAGVFPSHRALAEAPDRARALEEERRLAYVAWTRARRSLTILYDPATPSVFLQEAFDAPELVPA